jgi:cytochrome c oxidase cbb3-type subunit III
MSERDIDEVSGVETTGHEWDGIKELNNPLPRWWLWTFYGCIAVAAVTTVVYPAWPLFGWATPGVLHASTRAELNKDLAAAKTAQSVNLDKIAAMPVAQIAADPELSRFATAGGASFFKVYCTQCHGTGAEGGVGYPNLNDDEWLWGGSIDQIYATITHGARDPNDKDTHYNMMPNFGAEKLLTYQQIDTVAAYVASLSGLAGGADTPEGAKLFADNCASCHGEDGKGKADRGAPDLTDQIWLYKGSLSAIIAQINRPQSGTMPAWGPRLGDTTVKELAVYVHGLGGGT